MITRSVSLEVGGIYRVTVPWSDSDLVTVERVGDVIPPSPPPPSPPPSLPPVVINDRGDGFSAPGWLHGSGIDYPEYYGSDVTYWNGTPGPGPAVWTSPALQPGTYRVSATWFPHANRALDCRFTVVSASGEALASKTVNQRVAPSNLSYGNTPWEDLGDVTLPSPNTLSVRLSAQAGGLVIADAVRFEWVGSVPTPPPAPAFRIDLRTAGLTPSQAVTFRAAADRWQRVIVGDLPDANYNGTAVSGIIIDVSAAPVDGAYGVLAQSGPNRLRPGSYLPYHAGISVDSGDLARLESNGSLLTVALHEIGHCLGFGTLWAYMPSLVSGNLFVGANAVREYNRAFGLNATGVPLEDSGGTGTAGSHWSDQVFSNELMTGYLSLGVNPLSRVTVAAMADLGYVVDFSQADPYPSLMAATWPRERYNCGHQRKPITVG